MSTRESPPAWLVAYRQSVSWGDQIRWATDDPSGHEAAFIEGTDSWVVGVHSTVIPDGVGRCLPLERFTGTVATLLLIDQQLSAMRVEQLIWLATRAGVGIDFLGAEPRLHRDQLVLRLSEGDVQNKARSLSD